MNSFPPPFEKIGRSPGMHPEQTEDNESRFLIESPVPCSGINSNYAAAGHAPSMDLEFMQSFQNLHCP